MTVPVCRERHKAVKKFIHSPPHQTLEDLVEIGLADVANLSFPRRFLFYGLDIGEGLIYHVGCSGRNDVLCSAHSSTLLCSVYIG